MLQTGRKIVTITYKMRPKMPISHGMDTQNNLPSVTMYALFKNGIEITPRYKNRRNLVYLWIYGSPINKFYKYYKLDFIWLIYYYLRLPEKWIFKKGYYIRATKDD
jgi:hypothetical protein